MVDDQKSNELIKWSEDGESFIGKFHILSFPSMY